MCRAGGSQDSLCLVFFPWVLSRFLWGADRKAMQTSKGSGFLQPPFQPQGDARKAGGGGALMRGVGRTQPGPCHPPYLVLLLYLHSPPPKPPPPNQAAPAAPPGGWGPVVASSPHGWAV